MLEMENFKHCVSSVYISGYSVNSAGQLKRGKVLCPGRPCRIYRQVSEVESCMQDYSDEAGPCPPKDSFQLYPPICA